MYASYLKRTLDVIITLALLMACSWLFALITLCYVITFSYPVIFHQSRIGRNGTPFMLYKFRTLTNKELPLALRRFPLGNFLRKTSLDELPQLINVLRGDMSLIGPRPLPLEYIAHFSTEEWKRHKVRPGISGLAQVNGRNGISWKNKFQFDLYYLNNLSFRLDLTIAIKTVLLLLSFKKDVSLDEQEFMGNA